MSDIAGNGTKGQCSVTFDIGHSKRKLWLENYIFSQLMATVDLEIDLYE